MTPNGMGAPALIGNLMRLDAHARQQQRAAGDYIEAFFSRYLLGDSTKLDYLVQQSGQQCGYPGNPPTCGSPRRRFNDLDNLNVAVSVCSCLP